MERTDLLLSLCQGSRQLRRRDFTSGYLVTRSLSSPQASYSQRNLKYAPHPQPTDALRRCFSRAMPTGANNKISIGPKREAEKEEKEDGNIIYYDPISSTIKKVKLLSLSTCCLSVSLGPMMSWLATYLPKTLKFSDIHPAETNRPFVTFKANNSFYFVDTQHCHNKALLARLTPQKSSVHESALKNL